VHYVCEGNSVWVSTVITMIRNTTDIILSLLFPEVGLLEYLMQFNVLYDRQKLANI